MLGATLADVHSLGMGRHEVHDCGRHQPVVEHHVRLLQQTKCTQRHQVGIARTGTDQVDFTRSTELIRFGQRLIEQRLCLQAIATEDSLGNGSLQHVLPEFDTIAFGGQSLLDPRALAPGKIR